MKAWEVLAIQHDGEIVCPDCYTAAEQACANDTGECDNMSPVFASDIEGPEYCSRCGYIIEGSE